MDDNQLFFLHSELWKQGHGLYVNLLNPASLAPGFSEQFSSWLTRAVEFLRTCRPGFPHNVEYRKRSVTLRTELLRNIELARGRAIALDENQIAEVRSYPDAFRFPMGSCPDYEFRFDCFSWNIPTWETELAPLREKTTPLQVLEIGSMEGFSTCWIAENLLAHPDSRLTCVDLFEPGNSEAFMRNIARSRRESKIILKKGPSQQILRTLPLGHSDFIYIDGSRTAADVLEDLVLSWRLLRQGGMLVLDAYSFPNFAPGGVSIKDAVDVFATAIDSECLRSCFLTGRQMVFKKYPGPAEGPTPKAESGDQAFS